MPTRSTAPSALSTPTQPASPVSLTAFADGRIVARGCPHTVARLLATTRAGGAGNDPLVVIDDHSGRPVDAPDLRTLPDTGRGTVPGTDLAAPPTAGRPRLGVVAREVTLLPRHWEWLATQPGGASATLRRLVDKARSQPASATALRQQARDTCYHAMSALAGDRSGFEAASRALFSRETGARADFLARIAAWPDDVREYLTVLAGHAFAPADT